MTAPTDEEIQSARGHTLLNLLKLFGVANPTDVHSIDLKIREGAPMRLNIGYAHGKKKPLFVIDDAEREKWNTRADLAPAPLPAPDHRLGYWCGLVRGEPFAIFLKATSSAKHPSYGRFRQPDQWVYLGPLPYWRELDK